MLVIVAFIVGFLSGAITLRAWQEWVYRDSLPEAHDSEFRKG